MVADQNAYFELLMVMCQSVKVLLKVIPGFRILRLTFSESQPQNPELRNYFIYKKAYHNSFSDLFSDYLNAFNLLNLKLCIFIDILQGTCFEFLKFMFLDDIFSYQLYVYIFVVGWCVKTE